MISFKGCHFPKEVILMGIRWYVQEVIKEAYFFHESSEDDSLDDISFSYHKISTLSFGRGYYSGFLNDHEASVSFYSTKKENALFGIIPHP